MNDTPLLSQHLFVDLSNALNLGIAFRPAYEAAQRDRLSNFAIARIALVQLNNSLAAVPAQGFVRHTETNAGRRTLETTQIQKGRQYSGPFAVSFVVSWAL